MKRGSTIFFVMGVTLVVIIGATVLFEAMDPRGWIASFIVAGALGPPAMVLLILGTLVR